MSYKDCIKEHCHCHHTEGQDICTSDITFCKHCTQQKTNPERQVRQTSCACEDCWCGKVQSTQQKNVECEDEFDEKFLNPDPISSKSQFKPELQGKLYRAFKAFLVEKITEARKQAYNSGFYDGVKAQQDITEKEYQANIKANMEKLKEETID